MGEVDTAVIDTVFYHLRCREWLRDLQTQRWTGLAAQNALEAPMKDAGLRCRGLGGGKGQRVSKKASRQIDLTECLTCT